MIESADKDKFLKMFQEQRKEEFKVCVTRVWFFERCIKFNTLVKLNNDMLTLSPIFSLIYSGLTVQTKSNLITAWIIMQVSKKV